MFYINQSIQKIINIYSLIVTVLSNRNNYENTEEVFTLD